MRAARALPSSARRRRRLRRAPTAANSAATYKPVRRIRKRMTSAATSIGPGDRIPTASARRFEAAQLDPSATPAQHSDFDAPSSRLSAVLLRNRSSLLRSRSSAGPDGSGRRAETGAWGHGGRRLDGGRGRDRRRRRRGAPSERRRRKAGAGARAAGELLRADRSPPKPTCRIACGCAGRRRATTGATTRSSCSSRTASTAAAPPGIASARRPPMK